MKKGRSTYTFDVSANASGANQVVQSYITARGFKEKADNGETYFVNGDAMTGSEYFNYNISGNTLTITAWLRGAFGDICVEQDGLVGMNIMVMEYRKDLVNLFNEIQKVINGGNMNNNENNATPVANNQPTNNQQVQPMNNNQNNVNQVAQTFQDQTNAKKEKLCEIGFWLSILGVIFPLFGVSFGVLVYILDIYFATLGMHTKKKNKAIATIVLSIISVALTILLLIKSNN